MSREDRPSWRPYLNLLRTPDPKVIDHLPRHQRQLINFNSDRWLTTNSLTLLQQSGIGGDEGFYRLDGIFVVGDRSLCFRQGQSG
jgi:hypothetical protein